MERFDCSKCLIVFDSAVSLNTHAKNGCARKNSKIVCKCGLKFATRRVLATHIEKDHGVELSYQYPLITTNEEFYAFKLRMEKEGKCEYILPAADKRTGKVLYACHRSGFLRSSSTGQRRIKSQGTNKLGYECPSVIIKEVACGIIKKVTYQSVHFDAEDHNAGHINLTKDDRQQLADKLKAGIAMDQIIDDIRDGEEPDPTDPVSMVSKRTLHNIKRDFGLFPGRFDPNDLQSVKNFVELMKSKPMNPVRYFRPPPICLDTEDQVKNERNGFMLVLATDFQLQMLKERGNGGIICMDSTHGLANKLQLTSIVVVDEFGRGVVTAFCISSGTSSVEWEIFLNSIKEAMGGESISATVLMTDNDPSFYNGWTRAMGPVQHRLLCAWHVDQCWRRNLKSKITDKVVRDKTYKVLKHLQLSVKIDGFTKLYDDVMEVLDPEFKVYFLREYGTKVEQWAYCYRTGSGITCNNYIESFHSNLKKNYFNSKVIDRIDKCIHALMKVARNQMFDRVLYLVKDKYTLKENLIVKRHATAIKEMADVQVTTLESNLAWKVSSLTNEEVSYGVILENEVCPIDCLVKCRTCQICPHMYYCDCVDHLTTNTICKHIHIVAMTFNASVSMPSAKKIAEKLDDVTSQICSIEPDCHQAAAVASGSLYTEVISLAKRLEKPHAMAEEDVTEFKSLITRCNELLGGAQLPEANTTLRVPANKKAQTQMRFETPKRKKRSGAGRLTKPNKDEDPDTLLQELKKPRQAYE